MKKRLFIFLMILPFLLAACSKEDDAYTNLSEIKLADNQALITGQVTSRIGNDIELALGTIIQAQFPGNMDSMPSNEAGMMPSGDMGPMPSDEAGMMPSGGMAPMPSGGPGNRSRGGVSKGGFPADGSNSSGGMAQETEAGGAALDTQTAAGAQIRLSGETISITMPVGTTVLVTSDGTLSASSFGRIQVDDILQLIVNTNADGSQTVTLAQIME